MWIYRSVFKISWAARTTNVEVLRKMIKINGHHKNAVKPAT